MVPRLSTRIMLPVYYRALCGIAQDVRGRKNKLYIGSIG